MGEEDGGGELYLPPPQWFPVWFFKGGGGEQTREHLLPMIPRAPYLLIEASDLRRV